MPQRLVCAAILLFATGCAMPGGRFTPRDERAGGIEEPLDVRVERVGLRGIEIDKVTGDIWTALARGGVVQWSSTGQVKTSFARSSDTGEPSIPAFGSAAHDVALAPDGTVWVATDYGAAKRTPDGTWSRLEVPLPRTAQGPSTGNDASDQPDLSPDRAIRVAVDSSGGVWFGGLFGAVRLAPDGEWEHAPWPTDYGYKIGSIRVAANGDVWFGTLYKGVHVRRADGTWQSWETVGSPPQPRVWDVGFLPDGRVLALHGTDLAYAMGTEGCLLSILDDKGQWTFDPILLTGLLPNGEGHRLAVDAAGKVWVALQDGRFLVPDAAAARSWHVESIGVYYFNGQEDIALDASGTPWLTGDLGLYHRRSDGGIDHFDDYEP